MLGKGIFLIFLAITTTNIGYANETQTSVGLGFGQSNVDGFDRDDAFALILGLSKKMNDHYGVAGGMDTVYTKNEGNCTFFTGCTRFEALNYIFVFEPYFSPLQGLKLYPRFGTTLSLLKTRVSGGESRDAEVDFSYGAGVEYKYSRISAAVEVTQIDKDRSVGIFSLRWNFE